ncbi:MAG: hypothetical protein OXG97_04505 [Candidatus Poribacteria bacterium]|nr:hypothetical protein [Candidatus Poribacteria bacterium]
MKMPKLVVGYLLDEEVFVKSFTIPESHDWIKWLANEELAQFFGELFELMIQISEEKEDSETLRTFLDFWHEIALSWREIALGEEDSEILEKASETLGTIVTNWNEAILKGQDPEMLLNSLAGLLGKAMIDSERDVLSDILGAEQELDAPWIDIVEVQQAPSETSDMTDDEMEAMLEMTEEQRDFYLDQSLSDFGLSGRAQNCLERQNIRTIRELVAKEEWDLMKYKGLGEGTLNEIRNRLAFKGFYLGMDLDNIDDEEEF